jgi:hypothetical protein
VTSDTGSAHVTDRLSAYLDRELPALERGAVEGHLGGCDACARRLEELAAVDEALRGLPADAPAGYFEGFAARVRRRLEPPRRRTGPPVWTWAAAAVLLLAVVTPLTLDHRQTAKEETRLPQAAARPAATLPAAPADTERARGEALAPRGFESGRDESGRSPDQQQTGTKSQDVGARPKGAPPLSGYAPAPSSPQRVGTTADADVSTRSHGGRREAGPVTSAAPPAFAAPAARDAPAAPAPAVEPAPDGMDESVTAEDDRAAPALAMRRLSGASSSVAVRVPPEEGQFQRLLAARPDTLEQWRSAREVWRAFVLRYPAGRRADEARVQVIVTGIAAWRLSGAAEDRSLLEQDAAEYLAREDAAQKDRVRALMESVAR